MSKNPSLLPAALLGTAYAAWLPTEADVVLKEVWHEYG
jgi:hypothetical protein